MSKLFSPEQEWRSQIPVPVYDGEPELNGLYWKAWELAHDHLIDLPGMPQTPYMDEAFCDTDIWIWDTCFMALFCNTRSPVSPEWNLCTTSTMFCTAVKRFPGL